jgi:hypothetical protein
MQAMTVLYWWLYHLCWLAVSLSWVYVLLLVLL